VLGPMVGTVIFMERLRDSLSEPVAWLTTRPMTTGSMVGRRPLRPPRPPRKALEAGEPTKRAADHLGCEVGQCGTVGRRTLVVGRHGSATGRAGREGSVELVGAPEGGKIGVVVVVGAVLDAVFGHEVRHAERRGSA
jgi:hypothetical protein